MCYLTYHPKQPLSKQWKSFPTPEENSPGKIKQEKPVWREILPRNYCTYKNPKQARNKGLYMIYQLLSLQWSKKQDKIALSLQLVFTFLGEEADVRNYPKIQSLKVGKNLCIINLFADDYNVFLKPITRNADSYKYLPVREYQMSKLDEIRICSSVSSLSNLC